MDCPNCGERPVGIFHTYRFGNTGLKKNLQGFIRCRNCGAWLKQKWGSSLFPTYKKPFWTYYIIINAVAMGLLLLVIFNLSIREINPFITMGIILVILVGIVGIFDELKARYWVLEEINPEEVEEQAIKISTTGLIVLSLFALLAIFGVTQLDKLIEWYAPGQDVYTIGAMIYTFVVVIAVIMLYNYFTDDDTGDSPTRAS